MARRRNAFTKATQAKADADAFDRQPRGTEKIWDGIKAKAAPSRPPTPRAAIEKLFGKGPRGKGVNTKAAAEALGVSQRTVQRWVHDRKTPKSEAGTKLQQQYQGWQNTPRGRASTLGRKKLDEVRETRRFSVTGTIRISSYVGKRTNMGIDITPESRAQWNRFLDHTLAGDDAAAHEALEDVISESGGFGGSVSINLDHFEF